jgi:hypothetical protein
MLETFQQASKVVPAGLGQRAGRNSQTRSGRNPLTTMPINAATFPLCGGGVSDALDSDGWLVPEQKRISKLDGQLRPTHWCGVRRRS